MLEYLVNLNNPSTHALKDAVSKMPNAEMTEWGNYNVNTRVKARSPESTYIIGEPNKIHGELIDRASYEQFALEQDNYLSRKGLIEINGTIGNTPPVKANVSLLVEKSFPNIAAMQQQLFFNGCDVSAPDFKIIYTPDMPLSNFPKNRYILVDLDNYTTRIAGTDYFGESKKAGLRMWNKWIYEKGGLALHAGCKTYAADNGSVHSMLIIGLSGTGKTTTTFTPHMDSRPIQDDFCAFFPYGKLFASENGCFAKTFGLDPHREPLIYQGLSNKSAWFENTYVKDNGQFDFNNDSITQNGRGTFELDFIPHGNLHDIPPLNKIIILNRNFDIIPAITKLNKEQACAFFMLGETTGTSAGGSTEINKSLRIPGTNPFFPLSHSLQGNRFLSLLDQSPNVEVFLMNTGSIGGSNGGDSSISINVDHSKHLINALLKDKIKWVEDKDFGYLLSTADSTSIESIFTNPKELYLRSGRLSEYEQIKSELNINRRAFLSRFANLDKRIINAI